MDSDGNDKGRRRAVAVYESMALENTMASIAPGDDESPPADEVSYAADTVMVKEAPAAPRTVEGYVVLDKVGEGGMGVVYKALDPTLGRTVALKLLRAPGAVRAANSSIGARVLREAQAMAKLSHPNVVSVYQAGIHGEAVFIAMEYIDGMTLTAWVRKLPRSWREIVGVLVRAGRGLEAAHRAGIVHRDFKPDNVLIGHDGETRVTDFGLARMQGTSLSSETAPAVAPSQEILMTQAGQILGTPVYMAPEQHRGERVDERADQFSFCVTLYEALFGVRPFAGDTYRELSANVAAGDMRPMPNVPKVPRYVRNVLSRGLSVDPQARYGSMTELLADLDRRPLSRRNVALAGIGIAGIGIGAASLLMVGKHATQGPCSESDEKIAGMWNQSKRGMIAEAFAATQLPYAEKARTSVFDELEHRIGAWKKMHREACEATRVRGVQSEALLDRRMVCLDHQRAALSTLVDLLAGGGRDIVQNAVVSIHQLPSIDTCADAEALMAGIETPRDPVARAEIEVMQRDLARGRIMLTTANFGEGLSVASGVVERAQRIKYTPVEAEGLLLEGLIQAQRGESKSAEDLITRASERADVAHADGLKANALIELVYVVGDNLGKTSEAEMLIRVARAAVNRVGSPYELGAKLESRVGSVALAEGRYPEALASYERALDLRRRVKDSDDNPEVAADLDRIGWAALRAGDTEKAFTFYKQAIAASERILGAEHPLTAEAVVDLGNVYATTGDFASAEQNYRKALEIWTKVLGPRHATTALGVSKLAALALTKGAFQDAIAGYQDALEIERAALGPTHPRVADTLAALGQAQLAANDPDHAISSLNDAIDIWTKGTRVPAECQVAKFMLAKALWQTGQNERALALAHEAQTALATEGSSAAKTVEEIASWLDEKGYKGGGSTRALKR